MIDMGMTDKQFNGFLRFIMGDLKDAIKADTAEEKNEKLKEILENIQKIIED